MRKADPVTVDSFGLFLPDLLPESAAQAAAVAGKSRRRTLKKPNQQPSPLSLAASFIQRLVSTEQTPIPGSRSFRELEELCILPPDTRGGGRGSGGGGGGGGEGQGGSQTSHGLFRLFRQEAVSTHDAAGSHPDSELRPESQPSAESRYLGFRG